MAYNLSFLTASLVSPPFDLVMSNIINMLTSTHKKTEVAIVEHFGKDAWSVECCGELIKALKITLADLTLLQPCIFLAIDNPLHLDRGAKKSLTK